MMNLKEMTHPACLPVVEDKQGQHGWQLLMFRIFHLRIQTQSDKHWLSNKNMNAAQRLKKWYITILLCFNLLCRLPKTKSKQQIYRRPKSISQMQSLNKAKAR